MAKKILVITGSPRKNGNTFAMADSFISAAKDKGAEVERFDAAFGNVGGCHACMKCYSKEGQACVFVDDFDELAPKILGADVIVYAMPVYWYTVPGQIKCVVDKHFSFAVGKKDVAGKQYALLICCEEADMSVIDGCSAPLKRSFELLKWTEAGSVFVTGVYEAGDISKTDGCSQAADLAASICSE